MDGILNKNKKSSLVCLYVICLSHTHTCNNVNCSSILALSLSLSPSHSLSFSKSFNIMASSSFFAFSSFRSKSTSKSSFGMLSGPESVNMLFLHCFLPSFVCCCFPFFALRHRSHFHSQYYVLASASFFVFLCDRLIIWI